MKIRELRRENNLTQEQLAEKMGLKYFNIGDWERGKCEPCVEDLKRLSNIFGVSIDYLVDNSDDFDNVIIKTPANEPELSAKMDIKMKISEKIKEIRQQNGLSQGKLSELLELPRYIIANWEQGRSLPSIEDVMRISEKLDCSIDYLLGKEDADFIDVESTPNKRNVTIKTPATVPGLSEQERELLQFFDKLGPFERDAILVQVKALAGRVKETLPK